jgi:hypothetical protein
MIVAMVVLCGGLAAPRATAADKGIVSKLTKNLGVTPEQAAGGAGAIFGFAKNALPAADFTKVAAAVPEMDTLLKAAPAATAGAALPGGAGGITGAGGLAGAAASALPGAAGGLASLVGPFTSLGMKPDMIGKFVPILVGSVNKRGGAAASGPLAKVLGFEQK